MILLKNEAETVSKTRAGVEFTWLPHHLEGSTAPDACRFKICQPFGHVFRRGHEGTRTGRSQLAHYPPVARFARSHITGSLVRDDFCRIVAKVSMVHPKRPKEVLVRPRPERLASHFGHDFSKQIIARVRIQTGCAR